MLMQFHAKIRNKFNVSDFFRTFAPLTIEFILYLSSQ